MWTAESRLRSSSVAFSQYLLYNTQAIIGGKVRSQPNGIGRRRFLGALAVAWQISGQPKRRLRIGHTGITWGFQPNMQSERADPLAYQGRCVGERQFHPHSFRYSRVSPLGRHPCFPYLPPFATEPPSVIVTIRSAATFSNVCTSPEGHRTLTSAVTAAPRPKCKRGSFDE